jgi:hypothetical protein
VEKTELSHVTIALFYYNATRDNPFEIEILGPIQIY